ncbi:MAG: Rieske (2Fe-2S) protein [Chloroflexi bacterium]|nr:Rieske (2Fe-2S) protein [Chloroflexota bacterium]
MADESNSEQQPAPPDPQYRRRDFLKTAWGTLATLAVGGFGYVGFRFLESRVEEGQFGEVIHVGNIEEFEPLTVTQFSQGRFFLVRMEDGGFLALYRKCTHLDCVVRWNDEDQHFHCPCHGSEFEMDGDVVNPPAPLPLVRFPIEINERGRISVDTGTLIERRRTSKDEFTYPPTPQPEEEPPET